MPTDHTRHFLDCIRAYDDVLRDHSDAPPAETVRQLIRALARLIEAASDLPQLQRDESEAGLHQLPRPDPPQEQIRTLIVENLRFGMYWTAAPDLDQAGEPTAGDIAEDLGDIWADIHWGLAMLEVDAETSEAYAVHLWRSMFRSHWGRHATEALRALVYLEREALA